MRTIAIGDIHGCIHTLENLLSQLKLKKSDNLIFLGDLIDRGPDSKHVLDKMILLKKEGYAIIPLMGNHEKLLLDAFQNREKESIWFYNGGQLTLDSMGITHAREINPEYIEFIQSFYYYFSFNSYYMVHAGFSEESENPLTDYEAMLWTRKKSYNSRFFANKKIVHGHTPVPLDVLKNTNFQSSQTIGIDTGCVYADRAGDYGYLSALDIANLKLYSAGNAD